MYNASAYIENCLSGISKQTTKDFEVILVDDSSTDDTIQKAKEYPFKILELKERGRPARARNYGAKNASGNILVFVDADVVLKPNSIEKITSVMFEPGTDVISGVYTENTPQTNFFSQLQNLILIYRYSKPPKFVTFTNSSFCAIRRDVFESIGGYDEKMPYYEDIEIGRRLIQKGYRCKLDPELKVTHLKYFSHLGLLRDYFKKTAVSGVYFRRGSFLKKLKGENVPASIKIAGISSGFILLSLGLIKISAIPLLVFSSIYFVSIAPLLVFLIKIRNLCFGLKSYFVCFEIFLVSHFGLAYGILTGNKNG